MHSRSVENLLSPKSGWHRANEKLQQLLRSGPERLLEGLNHRYTHNLGLSPGMPPEEFGTHLALLTLEDLAEYLIEIKGQKSTRESRENFCTFLDRLRQAQRHQHYPVQQGDAPPFSFSPADEKVILKRTRLLSIALVALWDATPQWLARLRRCRNGKCLHPFFLDKSAGAVAKTCGSVACRKSYSRAKQSRIGAAGGLSHIADVKKFASEKIRHQPSFRRRGNSRSRNR